MVPSKPAVAPAQSTAEIPLPEVTEGLLQIDGSMLEGWVFGGLPKNGGTERVEVRSDTCC